MLNLIYFKNVKYTGCLKNHDLLITCIITFPYVFDVVWVDNSCRARGAAVDRWLESDMTSWLIIIRRRSVLAIIRNSRWLFVDAKWRCLLLLQSTWCPAARGAPGAASTRRVRRWPPPLPPTRSTRRIGESYARMESLGFDGGWKRNGSKLFGGELAANESLLPALCE